MKHSRKTMKKGFTLVEVIVVAVIVAILAAVAIPIYQGYVNDSNKDQASNTAGSVASFCGACAAKGGACAAAGTPIIVTCPAVGTGTGSSATIQIPVGTTLSAITTGTVGVRATRGGQQSDPYFW
jgi:prepilin-type N-terminal cleavage/methylation domain-containing protein